MINWSYSLRIKVLRGNESGHNVFIYSRFGLTSDDCIGENLRSDNSIFGAITRSFN